MIDNKIEMKQINKEDDIDMLWEYECIEAQLSDIAEMLWYIIEDHYTNGSNDIVNSVCNYQRMYTYLLNTHHLLSDKCEQMQEIVKKAYKSKNINT